MGSGWRWAAPSGRPQSSTKLKRATAVDLPAAGTGISRPPMRRVCAETPRPVGLARSAKSVRMCSAVLWSRGVA